MQYGAIEAGPLEARGGEVGFMPEGVLCLELREVSTPQKSLLEATSLHLCAAEARVAEARRLEAAALQIAAAEVEIQPIDVPQP